MDEKIAYPEIAHPPMLPLTDGQDLATHRMGKHSPDYHRVFDPSSYFQAQRVEPPTKSNSEYVEDTFFPFPRASMNQWTD